MTVEEGMFLNRVTAERLMGLRTEMIQWEVFFVSFSFHIPQDYLLRERRISASRIQPQPQVRNLLLLTSVRKASYSSAGTVTKGSLPRAEFFFESPTFEIADAQFDFTRSTADD